MVKKLYKHEFLAWLRIMPVIYGILLVIAAACRLLLCFESDAVYYAIISGSSFFMYVIGMIVCIGAPTVFGIARFYKNLFTGEGYLTFTLPVTPTAHLWVKSLTTLCFNVASLLVAMLSIVIVTAGPALCKSISLLFESIPDAYIGHVIGYCIEFVLLLIVALFYGNMLYSGCICVGQISKKNRVISAVAVYFGYYMLTQIVSTIALVVFMFLADSSLAFSIISFMDTHPFATIHIALWGSILLYTVLSGLFFLICRYIMHKRLNLE